MVDQLNAAVTAGTQWFERTLDDSANRRVAVAEAFLAVDGILNIFMNVTGGLVVYEKGIRARLMAELPFMATENILMDAVKKGGDRQELHEKIRVLSQEAAYRVKQDGLPNDLLDKIAADPAFKMSKADIDALLDPGKFTGRSAEQVDTFVKTVVDPLLNENKARLAGDVQLNV